MKDIVVINSIHSPASAFTSSSSGMTMNDPSAEVKRFKDCVTERITVGAYTADAFITSEDESRER